MYFYKQWGETYLSHDVFKTLRITILKITLNLTEEKRVRVVVICIPVISREGKHFSGVFFSCNSIFYCTISSQPHSDFRRGSCRQVTGSRGAQCPPWSCVPDSSHSGTGCWWNSPLQTGLPSSEVWGI